MTNNIAAAEATNYAPKRSQYRLFNSKCKTGAPNTILVHGAVIPFPLMLHEVDQPNNLKSLFCDLGSFLHRDCKHNIWSFEYADEPVGLGYVNYGPLDIYGRRLINAIKKVKNESQNDTVNIIAHSMGGLIARYAAQNMKYGRVNKIITLDTGHLGFEMTGLADEVLVDNLPEYEKRHVDCAEDTKPGSRFIKALTKGFNSANYELVSLAAGEGLGGAIGEGSEGSIIIEFEKRLMISESKKYVGSSSTTFFEPLADTVSGIVSSGLSVIEQVFGSNLRTFEQVFGISSRTLFRALDVVDWSSSSMGQCDDTGESTGVDYGVKFDIVDNTDHLIIAVIIDRSQEVYKQIKRHLCKGSVGKR
jgi:hypothetical protein